MRFARWLVLALALLPGFALGQGIGPGAGPSGTVNITGGTISGATVGGSSVTATGSTTARTLAARAADVINAKDGFGSTPGAVEDGATDDTTALAAVVAGAHANAAPASKGILIDAPLFLAAPASITVPSDVGLIFRGAGRLVTAFGSLTGTNVFAWGGGYSSIPTASITGNATLGAVVMGLSHSGLTLGAAGTGYVPGDVLTLSGGTGTAAQITLSATQVVSASIATGGTGGTAGTQTVTGTTGFGVMFQASVTVTGGAITAVNSITTPGVYMTNPTVLTAEPVTGGNLTGATLSVVMGVGVARASIPAMAITNFGAYTSLPSGTISLTGGSGSGATLSAATWNVQSVPVTSAGTYATSTTPTITLTGGSPSYAARVIAIGQMPTINGSITAASSQIFGGYGYITGSPQVPQVEDTWFGADPTGVADSSLAEQRAAYSLYTSGGVLHSSAGPRLISDTILLGSGTVLRGDAGATVWNAAVSFTGPATAAYVFPFASIGPTMISNVNFKAANSATKVDHDISIRDMTFNYTNYVGGSGTPVTLRMATNLLFDHNRSINVASADALLANSIYTVSNNYTVVSGTYGNTGHDQWEGPQHGKIINNTVIAGTSGTHALYGILLDGGDTDVTFGIASDILVSGNTISGATQAGIYMLPGTQSGQVNNIRIIGNSIDCTGISAASGMSVKGFGSHLMIADNQVSNCNGTSIGTGTDSGGTPSEVTVNANRVVNPEMTIATSSSTIALGGNGSIIAANRIEAGTYDYGIAANGTNVIISSNSFATGNASRYNNSGATNPIILDLDGTAGNTFRSATVGNLFTDSAGTLRNKFNSSEADFAYTGAGSPAFRAASATNQVNFPTASGGATGTAALITAANSSDTNAAMEIAGKGTYGALTGIWTSTTDPTTTNIPTGMCADWNNTTAVTYKHWCNVSGTLRSVSMN